ncbi:MAG: DUF255 domain-containing protein [Flavobacteriales bacterium]|nr:DUF255 domain-containing protein [Flavobacteriales bacterium]
MKTILTALIITFSTALLAQEVPPIQWMTMEQAQEAMKVEKKKIFIDLYTDWCGWCKKMDATTFVDPNVAFFMNKYYYAVKFDAETKDTIVFNNYKFANTAPVDKRGTHYFAYSILDGQMSYPSFAILDENMTRIHVIAGFQQPEPFMSTLMFFGTNQYQQYTNYLIKQMQKQQEENQNQ